MSRFSRLPTSLPLRILLILLGVGQIVGTVGLVGYLSFRNGQKAVNDLASQLRHELTVRIQQELESYFATPHEINRLNANAFTQGLMDVPGAAYGESQLYQQMKIADTLALVYCGSAQRGEFFGILRSPTDGSLELTYSNQSTGFLRQFYSLDVQGQRTFFLREADTRYDSRQRPWYKATAAAQKPAWTDVYIAFTTRLPNIPASLPVYDRSGRNLLGVCAADVVLPEEFRTFLQQLEIGESGQAFVVDRKGNLISNSTNEPLMREDGDEVRPLLATESEDVLVQKTANFLADRFNGFEQIERSQQLTFDVKGDTQFLEVLPFQDGFGLDWLIVVVVPESEFMGQIQLNTRITIVLCGLALAIALAVGTLLAQRLTSPILQLNAAVKEIAAGRWQQRVEINRTDELGELADSVNQMAGQIQQSFERLAEQRNAFSRFFPPEYLQFMNKQSVTEVQLGDHVSRKMTVMFSDIRGFTNMAEKMKARKTFQFINNYLQRISPLVRTHNGFVVKYMGDGMMAVFPYTAENAIDSAISQFQKVQEHNQQIDTQSPSTFAIEIGIGLHFGKVMAGMIGEPDRMQPDALSDTVNLAARLEGLSKVYGAALIISETVRRQLKDHDRYQLRFLDRVIVKGRTEEIAVYEVLDAEPDMRRRQKLETLPAFEAGITAYTNQDLDTAAQHFHTVCTQHPQDKTAQLYQQRIQYLLREGMPKNWNGAWELDHKR